MTSSHTTESTGLCHQIAFMENAERISGRESNVLAVLAVGADDMTIASQLHVSHRTVRAHISSLFRKLHVNNRTEAALIGLIDHLRSCERCVDAIRMQGVPISSRR
ncbi:MAG TPA: helix-turn-helix transcriptional regulator [Actinocrinis sp.]